MKCEIRRSATFYLSSKSVDDVQTDLYPCNDLDIEMITNARYLGIYTVSATGKMIRYYQDQRFFNSFVSLKKLDRILQLILVLCIIFGTLKEKFLCNWLGSKDEILINMHADPVLQDH